MKPRLLLFSALVFAVWGCKDKKKEENVTQQEDIVVQTAAGPVTLPPPYATESARNESRMVDWPEAARPKAPAGFTVEMYARELDNPRQTYMAPNGDLFVVESNTRNSKDQITLIRDRDYDGNFEARNVFLKDLNQPFGMLVLGDWFYVANTDALLRFPYKTDDLKITAAGQKILDLPAGGYNNHWTRNLIASEDGKKIYISVGSGSNVGENGMEHEVRRAAILEINPDGSGERIYAEGLRNPVGMDFNPETGELWAAVNERDELGDDLVPDYLTSVKPGKFYGWPYAYFGPIEDPRRAGERPDLVAKTAVPEVALGSHTAALGLAFYTGKTFPDRYKNGAFSAQHGSWNRSALSGYKVVFVPFENGKPTGPAEDFLVGFLEPGSDTNAYGRPSAVLVLPDGSLLVNDDSGNTLWKVSYRQ